MKQAERDDLLLLIDRWLSTSPHDLICEDCGAQTIEEWSAAFRMAARELSKLVVRFTLEDK